MTIAIENVNRIAPHFQKEITLKEMRELSGIEGVADFIIAFNDLVQLDNGTITIEEINNV